MRFWVVLLVWLAISCNEIRECGLSSARDFAVVAFYEADSTTKYRKDSIFVGDISNPLDTLTPREGVNAIILNMDPTDTTVLYGFELNGEAYDLRLNYQKSIEIYYDECDPIFNYSLNEASSITFDSVAVIVEPLDEAVQINVEIYF